MNPLRRLLFGSGRLPKDLRASLDASDDIVFCEEGLSGSVIRRSSRPSGRLVEWERRAVSGAIAVTVGGRVLVWAGRFKHIDVPMTHPLWAAIEFRIDRPNRVCFAYDPATTDPGGVGTGRSETENVAGEANCSADDTIGIKPPIGRLVHDPATPTPPIPPCGPPLDDTDNWPMRTNERPRL